jgi:hypothetical protein
MSKLSVIGLVSALAVSPAVLAGDANAGRAVNGPGNGDNGNANVAAGVNLPTSPAPIVNKTGARN